MGRLIRRASAAMTAIAALAMLAGPVSALLVWTAAVSPLTATAGQSNTFSFTATNLDLLGALGCVEVSLPPGWTNVSAGAAVPSSGRNDWVASASGTTVVARSTSGGGRLALGQSVRVSISAQPSAAGVGTISSNAHQRQDCTGADEPGTPILVTVLPPIVPSPPPVPTLAPTPTPTARPTVLPTATPRPSGSPPSSSTPRPTGSARPTVAPTDDPGTATATPSGSARPTETGSPGPGSATPGVGRGGPGAAGRVLFDDAGLDIGLGDLGMSGGVMVWSVPAAALGVPGLIILLWVGLQAIGALAWLPIVRRFRGDEEPRAGMV